jgi:hypothetical protein
MLSHSPTVSVLFSDGAFHFGWCALSKGPPKKIFKLGLSIPVCRDCYDNMWEAYTTMDDDLFGLLFPLSPSAISSVD